MWRKRIWKTLVGVDTGFGVSCPWYFIFLSCPFRIGTAWSCGVNIAYIMGRKLGVLEVYTADEHWAGVDSMGTIWDVGSWQGSRLLFWLDFLLYHGAEE